jgi:hypothetical protein
MDAAAAISRTFLAGTWKSGSDGGVGLEPHDRAERSHDRRPHRRRQRTVRLLGRHGHISPDGNQGTCVAAFGGKRFTLGDWPTTRPPPFGAGRPVGT